MTDAPPLAGAHSAWDRNTLNSPRAESITRFRCIVCGRVTAGRMPRKGDTTARMPRWHTVAGKVCDGVFREAQWV